MIDIMLKAKKLKILVIFKGFIKLSLRYCAKCYIKENFASGVEITTKTPIYNCCLSFYWKDR